MKKVTQLLTALVFVSLSIFMSCGGDGVKDPIDIRDAQGVLASGTFTPSTVSVDDSPREEWDSFSLTLTYNVETDIGTYQTSGVPTNPGASDVWPSSGTWKFGGTDEDPIITEIIRIEDNVSMTANPSATELSLDFTISEAGGRSATFDGNWSFSFSKGS